MNTVIFKNRQSGTLVQLHDNNSHSKLPEIFDYSWLIGRNLEVQKIVSMLTNEKSQRIIKVSGTYGCGRKVICKKAATYCIERNYFRDGAYEAEAGMALNC